MEAAHATNELRETLSGRRQHGGVPVWAPDSLHGEDADGAQPSPAGPVKVLVAPKPGSQAPVPGPTVVGALRALRALSPALPAQTHQEVTELSKLHRGVAALKVLAVVSRAVIADDAREWQACLPDDELIVDWPEPLKPLAEEAGLPFLTLQARDCNLMGTIEAPNLGQPQRHTVAGFSAE